MSSSACARRVSSDPMLAQLLGMASAEHDNCLKRFSCLPAAGPPGRIVLCLIAHGFLLATTAAATLLISVVPAGVEAKTLDQACQKFVSYLEKAKASGDKQKAQTVYTEGSKRITKKFNGATCPNVKAPTP